MLELDGLKCRIPPFNAAGCELSSPGPSEEWRSRQTAVMTPPSQRGSEKWGFRECVLHWVAE